MCKLSSRRVAPNAFLEELSIYDYSYRGLREYIDNVYLGFLLGTVVHRGNQVEYVKHLGGKYTDLSVIETLVECYSIGFCPRSLPEYHMWRDGSDTRVRSRSHFQGIRHDFSQ